MDTTTLAQISSRHQRHNFGYLPARSGGRSTSSGCVPRVDSQGLPGPEAGACQKADWRDCQDVDALSRSAHSCAAAARRLACKWRLSRPAVSPRRGKNNGAGECGDRQAFRSRKRICFPPEAVGRRTNVRMAWAVQASRQRLEESQSKGARISAPRFNQTHAEKAMQSSMISPDRLLSNWARARVPTADKTAPSPNLNCFFQQQQKLLVVHNFGFSCICAGATTASEARTQLLKICAGQRIEQVRYDRLSGTPRLHSLFTWASRGDNV